MELGNIQKKKQKKTTFQLLFFFFKENKNFSRHCLFLVGCVGSNKEFIITYSLPADTLATNTREQGTSITGFEQVKIMKEFV